jgi:hypothetical protein
MPAADVSVHQNARARIVPHSGLPVREDTAFTNAAGEDNKTTHKRAEADLEKAAAVLRRLLQPSEAVLYAARGAFMPNTWEQLMENHGALAVGALLVVTNQRLIALRTKSSGIAGWQWDQGILMLSWDNVALATKKGFLIGYFDVRDLNGRRERFFRLRWADAKKLRVLLGVLAPQSREGMAAAAGGAPGFTWMCPRCLAQLAEGLYQCPACGMAFRDEKTLLQRTLLIPGGAYFYVRQNLLGILTGLVEAILLVGAVLTLLASARQSGAAPAGASPRDTVSSALVTVGLFLMFLAFVKFSSYYRARRRIRQFIPA